MDSMIYRINDDNWTIFNLSKKKFKRKHGKRLAITYCDKKRMHLRKDVLSIETIKHELMHIHLHYCFLDSADLDTEQLEEVACEVFAERGTIMEKQAKEIYKKLKSL